MEEHDQDIEIFEPVDVSQPQEPRREQDIIKEALAIQRREWFRSHTMHFFVAAGIIVVGVIVFFVMTFYRDNNPVNRFASAIYKDFGTPFHYMVSVTENGEDKMHFNGTISVDRTNQTVDTVYEADYDEYSYTGACSHFLKTSIAGNLYQKEWSTHDCTESVRDFFDFDDDFRYGNFDCGAFMRFTGLMSDYSIQETAKMVSVLKKRLSTDSVLATITTEMTDEGEHFRYNVNLYQCFVMMEQEGAPIFYKATEYDAFCQRLHANTEILQRAECTIDYVINSDGYMTSLDINVFTEGTTYGFSCKMDDFGTAEVVLPEEFMDIVNATESLNKVE